MTIATDLALELASWKHADGSYVLGDAVRVPCPNESRLPVKEATGCSQCYGRLWVPSTRLEDWLEVARDFRFPDWTPTPMLWPNAGRWVFEWLGKFTAGGHADTPIEAIQKALKKVKDADVA